MDSVEIFDMKSRRIANKLTPIYSLPSELLAKIFKFGQELQWEENELAGTPTSQSVSNQPSEVLVTHVSSHFRQIAIGTPHLWSDITISSHISSAELETYLVRASGCALDVRIETGLSVPISPLMMAKIDTILIHSHRYRQLIINCIFESSAQLVVQRFNSVAMPDLKHLSIAIATVEGLFPPGDRKPFGAETPYLSFVRLRGLALVLFCLQHQSITTLHLDQTAFTPILYSTFRQVIISSSALQNLSLYGDLFSSVTTPWTALAIGDPIEIPTLRRLRISGVGGDMYSGILRGILAASLTSIVLKNLKQYDLQPFMASPFSSIKFPLLRELVLIDPDITSDEYTQLFYTFPTTTSFAVYHRETADVLRLLADDPVDGFIPWPELRTLSLLVDENDDRVIPDIVQRRKAIGCPLERMRLGTLELLSSIPDFSWLRNQVIVEGFARFDAWPEADFRDLEDTLFQYGFPPKYLLDENDDQPERAWDVPSSYASKQ
ncbi:hypothetical protein C0995_007534 [Termitomyces sp. Mi166|nr:hypothetical protein C0995_007534 [Termitomyces sp. Mi166\